MGNGNPFSSINFSGVKSFSAYGLRLAHAMHANNFGRGGYVQTLGQWLMVTAILSNFTRAIFSESKKGSKHLNHQTERFCTLFVPHFLNTRFLAIEWQ